MNRRTKITAVAAALLISAGAAGSAVASSEGGGGGHGKGGVREAAALTGSAKLYRPAGDDITFAFDAHLSAANRNDPLAATGTFRYSHHKDGGGGSADVKVDCLATGGTVATVTGIVTRTDVPGLLHKRVGVSVHDDGRHDRLGYSWLASNPLQDEVPPCNAAAPYERVEAGTGDFQVLPWRFDYPTE
ncbi:Repetin [Streptomyces sp. NBC_00691]|uniref:Repetin n=1 Tax=Streptomyces sp. NBC_00691 TaxID=2903671 RepID=UPI002E32A4C6|nr:Repetin [Streptomyces sp. NBC_00691]